MSRLCQTLQCKAALRWTREIEWSLKWYETENTIQLVLQKPLSLLDLSVSSVSTIQHSTPRAVDLVKWAEAEEHGNSPEIQHRPRPYRWRHLALHDPTRGFAGGRSTESSWRLCAVLDVSFCSLYGVLYCSQGERTIPERRQHGHGAEDRTGAEEPRLVVHVPYRHCLEKKPCDTQKLPEQNLAKNLVVTEWRNHTRSGPRGNLAAAPRSANVAAGQPFGQCAPTFSRGRRAARVQTSDLRLSKRPFIGLFTVPVETLKLTQRGHLPSQPVPFRRRPNVTVWLCGSAAQLGLVRLSAPISKRRPESPYPPSLSPSI